MQSIGVSAFSRQDGEHTDYRRQSMQSIEGIACSLYEVEHALNMRQSI